MSTVKWEAPAATSDGLTTELNSISNGAYSAAGTEVDNATDKALYMSLELNVTFGTNPSAGGYVSVFLLTAVDGTNYQDGDGVTPPATALVATFPLRAVTTAQRVHANLIPIPPFKFKLVAFNGSGQTTAASGNTVKYSRYNLDIA